MPPGDRILVLARYHHGKPASLEKAATRWPNLQLDFMTIHASKGQQADYVIVLGLHEGQDGFRLPPVNPLWSRRCCRCRKISRCRRASLAVCRHYRARKRVWLLFDKDNPSRFVDALRQLNVPVARKP
jgi:DNA helicase-4